MVTTHAYVMLCSCGDLMEVEAESREEAVHKLQSVMDEDAVAAHIADKHPGEAVPPLAAVHHMIDERLVAA